ncbi:hypothetical protein D3C81_910970 [compost metagenome]
MPLCVRDQDSAAADARTCRAALAAGHATDTGRTARIGLHLRCVLAFGRFCSALIAHLAADGSAQAEPARRMLILVLQLARRQGARDQRVLAVRDRLASAGNHTRLQVGIAGDVDLEATVARLDAALFRNAGKVTFGLALRDTAADAAGAIAERRNAQAHVEACAAALAGVGACILQADNIQVAANGALNCVCRQDRALQGRIATADDGRGLTCRHIGVGVVIVRAIGLAARLVGRNIEAKAILRTAKGIADADAGTAAAALARLRRRILCRKQVDLVVGEQGKIAACSNLAASYRQVAVRPCPGRNDADVARSIDRAADHRAAALVHVAFALAAAQADADLDASSVGQSLRSHASQIRGLRCQSHGRQGLHARVLRLFGGLRQAADAFHGIDNRHVDCAAKGHLAEGRVLLACIAVVRLLDQHVLAHDADIARQAAIHTRASGQHFAGRLRIRLARAQRHIAAQAGNLAAHLRHARVLAIAGGFYRAEGWLGEAADKA